MRPMMPHDRRPGRPKPKPAASSPSISRRSSRTGARCGARAAPRAMRRRGQGRRLRLRHRAGRGGAGAGRLRDVLRRPSRRGAARARAPRRPRRSTCSMASCPAPRRPTPDANLRPVIGSCAELDEWNAFRAASGWRGGAALHVDTGMNRLGFPFDEAPQLAARVGRDHGIALVMSHFACSEEDHPLNAVQIERFRARARAVSRHPGLARKFLRHFPRARCASRPGAPRRRALRRQPDAGQAEPDARRWSSLQGRIVQIRDGRAGRDRRLQRDLDGEAPDAARDRVGRLRGRLPARRERERRNGRARRRSSPGSAARSPAASRWT